VFGLNVSGWMFFWAGLGALVLWLRSSHETGTGMLPRKIRRLLHPTLQVALEIIVFVGGGSIIAVGLTQPVNVPQAFAAGLGWTTAVDSVPHFARRLARADATENEDSPGEPE
jgi:hypothetical protein